jgi:hypothetical protein
MPMLTMKLLDTEPPGLEPALGLPGYLRAFDPDADDGRGVVVVTQDRREAMRFDAAAAALAMWKRQSSVRPLRPDGQPNRPLTAFTVMLEQADA